MSKDSGQSDLLGFARQRAGTTVRMVIVLVTDAFVFAAWVGTTFGTKWLVDISVEEGVDETFANIFLWVSSVSTLILAVLYIVGDIVAEVRRIFRK